MLSFHPRPTRNIYLLTLVFNQTKYLHYNYKYGPKLNKYGHFVAFSTEIVICRFL